LFARLAFRSRRFAGPSDSSGTRTTSSKVKISFAKSKLSRHYPHLSVVAVRPLLLSILQDTPTPTTTKTKESPHQTLPLMIMVA
jgi:hypothetical protein